MNERILEIAKQAGLKFPSEATLSPAEIKFFRLIVSECASIAKSADDDTWKRDDKGTEIAKNIQQHFGVSE